MHKIIYFDEGTATDYIEITKGGKYEELEEKTKDRMRKAIAGIEAEGSAKFSLLPFLKIGAGTQMNGEISNHRNNIITNTLSNTVLTDYLKISKTDRKIKKFRKCNIYAYKESMTFFKMYTPYMIIAKQEDEGVDLSRLNEALEMARGYYEMIIEKPKGLMKVLRFNIRAFRNNYGLSDLTKMKLTYHAIEVGKCDESQLDMKNEFDFENRGVSADDVLGMEQNRNSKLSVYDVILAGIE